MSQMVSLMLVSPTTMRLMAKSTPTAHDVQGVHAAEYAWLQALVLLLQSRTTACQETMQVLLTNS